ncbi:guanylate kinase [Dokdonella koreensis]|uniref:Guanylate kinase n=1 Tax=Dokdonella koreensis DS-123 TaxID=1300342 RepID=A0A161HJL2_9GAMM|nr:guanylate kinase [Dokdonella koreensis]ANB17036.1 Guanylate kinase [Dokdonella koreensis DS-123]
MTGTLYVIAAASGSGKTSLVKALLEREPDLALSVSYTSRPPRPGEVDGQHYHFVSRQVFEHMAQAGAFFEYANVHGDYKGTARSVIEPLLAQGRDVLLEIDWQGAEQVRRLWPDTLSVFILPPSRAELERRLRHRASDSPDQITRRLADSRIEIAHAREFDFIVVNDDFAQAVTDLRAIFACRRLRRDAQLQRHATLFDDLLKPD